MGLDGPEEWHVAPGGGDDRDLGLDDAESDGDAEGDADEDAEGDEFWEEAAAAGQGGGGRVRGAVAGRNPGWVMGVVAVVAAAVGVAAGLVFVHWPGTAVAAGPGASASAPASPSASAGGGGGNGGLPALPPLSGNGNGEMQVSLVGKVVAVSGTSITLGGNGPSVTAAFTGSTKFGGKVTSPAGIKVGDEVSATVTGSSSKLTVASIQDPASAP
jgi:hypothetical protein